jgi:two-component system chemotaxis response regulator CheY
MKIFAIADDSPVIRKVTRRLVEDYGFVVVEAPDGNSALSLCRTNMPDAILVDWEMPDMHGVDVVREIAAMPEAERCKIVFMTSEMLVPEMTRAKRAGAAGFLMKPFNRKILAAKLGELGLIEPGQKAA